MAKRPANHLHKYKKVQLGKNGFTVFKCLEPACTHYIRYELAENKLCKCNRCGEPMLLDKAAMQLVKPHCQNCTRKRKDDTELEAITDFLEELEP